MGKIENKDVIAYVEKNISDNVQDIVYSKNDHNIV
jgi:hypothetical protein